DCTLTSFPTRRSSDLVAGGALMWAVHFLNRALPLGEYGLFVVYLSIIMCIPTIPLQMAMAHQTARALAMNRRGELAGMIRLLGLDRKSTRLNSSHQII